jgi:hypothetical protein
MEVLKLVLKKEWFDLFDSGIKKEEYRTVTNYILPRVLKMNKPLELPQFSIRYTKIRDAYWFCRGFKSKEKRIEVVKMLLDNCAEYRKYDAVQFQLGYKKDAKRLLFELNGISFGEGNPYWGAEPGESYFVLSVGKKLFIKTDLTDEPFNEEQN